MPILGIMASQISGHLIPPSSFYSIATASPSGVSTITFSSIPGTYKSLQIRISAVVTSAGQDIYTQFNGDTTSGNYRNHGLWGNGSSAGASVAGPNSSLYAAQGWVIGTVTTYPNVSVIDIIDYASTTKNKTQRYFSGANDNTTTNGSVELSSGFWMSTSAVTSITVYTGSTFSAGTSIALYGVL